MKKKFNLFLAGSFAVAATASAQLAPAPAPEQQRIPQQEQQVPSFEEEASPQANPAALQAQLEEMHREIDQLSNRLNDIHQQALLKSDVRQLLIDHERAVGERIREAAPGLENQVEQQEQVLDALADLDADGEDAGAEEKRELERLLAQHGEVKRQLAPIENQFLNDAEFLEAHTEYQEALLTAMKDVDSEVDSIIEQRMELAQNFMTIQQQFLESQQQNQVPQQQQLAPQSGQPQERSAPQRPN